VPEQNNSDETMHCPDCSEDIVDLSFLRTLAGSKLPRSVPIGPAFHLVLAYQAAGYVELSVPPQVRTRSGHAMQPDAVVLAMTPEGLAAVAAFAGGAC
jgi:hypothetical protein